MEPQNQNPDVGDENAVPENNVGQDPAEQKRCDPPSDAVSEENADAAPVSNDPTPSAPQQVETTSQTTVTESESTQVTPEAPQPAPQEQQNGEATTDDLSYPQSDNS